MLWDWFKGALVLSAVIITWGCEGGDTDPEPECYLYSDCEDGEVCVQQDESGAVIAYREGSCVSEAICREDRELLNSIRVSYQPPEEQRAEYGDAFSRFDYCTPGEPLKCISERSYSPCSWRDYESPHESGCYFYLLDAPVDDPSFPLRINETECPEGSICVEGREGVTCVPTCSTSDECSSGEACQLSQGNSQFFCEAPSAGPVIESRCTVTALDAVVDGADLEGTNVNQPDLFLVLRTGDIEEKTRIIEGTERPVWNHEFSELSYEQVASMSLELMEDDEAFIIIPNFDDSVFTWTGEGGTWWLASLEETFNLSGGPVERLSVRVYCW